MESAGRMKSLNLLKPHCPSTHMDLYTPRIERSKTTHVDLDTPRGKWGSIERSQVSVCLDSLLDTPKENFELSSSLSLHKCERPKDLEKDLKKEQVLQTGLWETPKVTKKSVSLRRRLLMSKSATDGKKTPGCRESRLQGHVGIANFYSPDMSPTMPLSYSTLKADSMAICCRQRQHMFSQAITSTLEGSRSGGNSPVLRSGGSFSEHDLNESIISGLLVSEMPETPQSGNFAPLAKENFQTPINNLAANLCESLSVLSTPSHTPISKLDANASEDSGFSSLGLDKSQDSSIDDGSFQEMMQPWASHSKEKRRSRLDRQRRLSTLKEGGSQSEEDHRAQQVAAQHMKDEDVFLEATPVGAASVKLQDLSLTPALQMVHAMSQRSTRILTKHPSLDELLRVSTLEGPIETTLPLSGLIGRKMGLGKMDILTELSKRNLRHVLAIILKLLSSQDIYMCGQVSEAWGDIIMQDKRACRRKKLYEREMKIALEMGSAARVPDAETRLNLACRSALSSVQAQAKTPIMSAHTPAARRTYTPLQHMTPQSSTKRQEFLQVAKTLFSDECLKPCPRCQHPARCHSARGEGVCSWADCLFHFCTSCLCSYHGSRDCAHLTKRRSRKDLLPGSAQSKRNEALLSSDSLLVEFLNEFLLLPLFLEPVRYNRDRGLFEVGIDPAESFSTQITAQLTELQDKSTDPTWFPTTPLIDNRYTISCLDPAQAIQWIRTERLPFFLQSDYYFEYRLAYCLSQMTIPKWTEEDLINLSITSPQQESVMTSVHMGYSEISSDCSSPHTDCSAFNTGVVEDTRITQIQTNSNLTLGHDSLEAGVNQKAWPLTQLCEEQSPSNQLVLNDFSTTTVQHNITEVDKEGRIPRAVLGETSVFTNCTPSPECRDGSPASQISVPEELSTSYPAQDSVTKLNSEAFASTALSGLECATGTIVNYGIQVNKQVFLDFKSFLQGRTGERVLNLWMDIERLKTLRNPETINRHLVWVKNQYLPGRGSTALSVEFLSRLDLISTLSWTENKLHLVQPLLTEVLLFYWGQRFILHTLIEKRCQKVCFLQPCWDCPAFQQDSCPIHPNPPPLHSAYYIASESPAVDGSHDSEMERMVQVLHMESKTGFFFTNFCQNSENQLWENAAQFCSDLQEYHQLFYQPTLDPYRVQQKAQLLYATYVCSWTAVRSVGLEEQYRQDIFAHLRVPFEELFDQAEEHAHYILLEPWTLLTQQDTDIFHRVAMWKEERFVEPELYKTLQDIYTQTQCRQKQFAQEHKPPSPPAKEFDPWAQVPHQFRHHRLGFLLRNRMELQNFLAFLEENFASVDLLCWLDIEQLKRIPNDMRVREEKCQNIRNQYLNRNYLFGPSSPANKQQQTELLRLAGGWTRLQCEPISTPVLSEIQSLVRNRIERKWLPRFLSSKEFIARQKQQAEHGDGVQKRKIWKQVDGGLMGSSREALALRKVLYDPNTCLHFRLFLSLRGELLENDLLFWLEVQRYKDLCNSHSDEVTVQQKVSAIISCFIDCCFPPSVQIHIPPEQAQRILHTRNSLGPYVFREAQMSVFSELLKHWPAFVELRSSVPEKEIVPELEKRRNQERERQRIKEGAQQIEEIPEMLQGDRRSVLDGLMEEASMYEEGVEGEETDDHVGDKLFWSYSKHMAALENEEKIKHMQALQEKPSDFNSVPRVRSGDHKHSQPTSTVPPPRTARIGHRLLRSRSSKIS
uniref:RGS domain-containing protein n=1 Tax=Astyanax mexicanus TaxID=7994 RepID=W5KXG0_ASTMX